MDSEADQQNTSSLLCRGKRVESESECLQPSSLKDFAIIQFAKSWKFKTTWKFASRLGPKASNSGL